MARTVLPGRPYPQGATWDGTGVNFSLYSEKAAAVEPPKKPARKRVAAPKPQPGFFDFFSGGFNNNNARASNTRSRSAQSNGGFRPFF